MQLIPPASFRPAIAAPSFKTGAAASATSLIQSSGDRFSLRFASSLPTANSILERAGIETEDYNYDQNMIAARLLASGSHGIEADVEMAERFIHKAIEKLDDDESFFAAFQAAKLYAKGYYRIPQDRAKALTILNRIREASKKSGQEEPFYTAEAGMNILQYFVDTQTPVQQSAILQEIESSVKGAHNHMFLTLSVARFFAKVMNNPEKAKEFALLADQKHKLWNEESDAQSEFPSKSKGSLGAKELMTVVSDYARGENNMPKDPQLATTLLESLLEKVRTPNPVYQLKAAELYVNDLQNPGRAAELVDWILAETKYPPYIECARLLAKEINKPEQARALLDKVRKKPGLLHGPVSRDTKIAPFDLVRIAKIYAEGLKDPETALDLVSDVSLSQVYESQRTDLAIDLAELCGNHMGLKRLAQKYLDAGKPYVSQGGSGNPQKTRLALATAYLDIADNTSACISMIQELVRVAPRFILPEKDLKEACKLLERCEHHPEIQITRLEADLAIRNARQKGDIYSYDEDWES